MHMAEHPPSEPLAPPAAAPPPLTAERTGVTDASHPAPWPDPAVIARDVTTRLHPLIDHAVQRAIAPLAETIVQQTATIARLATTLHALHAALPPPAAREMTPDTPAQRPHALAAYQDAHQDMADQENARVDSLDREGAQDRRVADRRARDAGGIAQDRRVADRRAQQDRDRFEDAVLDQYVPPPPAPLPPHPPPNTPPAS